MSDTEKISDANIDFTFPVKIPYPVLNEYLQKKMVGEIIKKENSDGSSSNYAQILSISMEKSEVEHYNIVLNLHLQTLTTFFKNREVEVKFHASLVLDRLEQRIYMDDYLVDGKTNNWLADQFLETLTNKWLYSRLKKKINFDLMPHIENKRDEINQKLEEKIEAKEGIHVLGALEDLEVADFKVGENDLWISVMIKGTGIIEITRITL